MNNTESQIINQLTARNQPQPNKNGSRSFKKKYWERPSISALENLWQPSCDYTYRDVYTTNYDELRRSMGRKESFTRSSKKKSKNSLFQKICLNNQQSKISTTSKKMELYYLQRIKDWIFCQDRKPFLQMELLKRLFALLYKYLLFGDNWRV